MVGEMETKEKPKPTPDYLMQLMNDKKLMSSLPNFCGIFNHLERLLDEGEAPGPGAAARDGGAAGRSGGRAGAQRRRGRLAARPGPGQARGRTRERAGLRGCGRLPTARRLGSPPSRPSRPARRGHAIPRAPPRLARGAPA